MSLLPLNFHTPGGNTVTLDNAGQIVSDFHLWLIYLGASGNQMEDVCYRLLILELQWWLGEMSSVSVVPKELR